MKRLIAIALLCPALVAAAADIDSEARRIAATMPSVKALEAQATAEKESLDAANVLSGPEAEFEYKFGPEQNRWGVSIGQEFEFPGVYGARSKENRLRKRAFEALYSQELAQRTLDVKLAIISLAEARQLCDIVAEAAKSTDGLCEAYRLALKRGETTILELRKVELRQFAVSQQLAQAMSDRSGAEANLRALCAGETLQLSDSLELPALRDYEVYHESFVKANPGLTYSSLMADAENASVSTARRSALPSFRISYIHDFEEDMHFNGFGISLSLPSWNNRHNVAAARARAFAAEQTLADSRLLADAQFYAAYDKAQRLHGELEKGRKLFEADEYTVYLDKALKAGRINIFTYLTEQEDYLQSRLDYISLRASYARAEAELAKYLNITPGTI